MSISDAKKVSRGDTLYTKPTREPVIVTDIEYIQAGWGSTKDCYKFTVEFEDGRIARYAHPWLLV